MTLRSGKDCKVYMSTEHATNGFTSAGAIGTEGLAIPPLPSLTSSTYPQLGDVTAIRFEPVHEEINQAQYGYGTNVIAHPRKRATIEITRNRDSALFRNLYYSASWGVTGSSAAIDDGSGDIRTDSGFRVLYIEGSGANTASATDGSYTIMAHCMLSGYTTNPSPDGITQETITLTSADWVTPVDGAAVVANRTIN